MKYLIIPTGQENQQPVYRPNHQQINKNRSIAPQKVTLSKQGVTQSVMDLQKMPPMVPVDPYEVSHQQQHSNLKSRKATAALYSPMKSQPSPMLAPASGYVVQPYPHAQPNNITLSQVQNIRRPPSAVKQ